MLRHTLFALLAVVAVVLDPCRGQSRVLDPMDDPGSWKVITSDGVKLTVATDPGTAGKCLRLDYEFTTGAGYCIIQKPFGLVLPGNYELAFQIRGDGAPNNMEFKLLDDSGDTVWWNMRRAVEWPAEWSRFLNKKRDIEFAWGPSAGAPLKTLAKLEFAISSSSGGKGRIWIDELTFRELPPPSDKPLAPTATAGSESAGHGPALSLDGDDKTEWISAAAGARVLTLDLQRTAEFGGVSVTWAKEGRPVSVAVATSDDGEHWTPLGKVRAVSGPRTLFVTPGAEARYIRFTLDAAATKALGIAELKVRPPEFGKSLNDAFVALAKEEPRGRYPRYFSGEQTYWTVVGAEADDAEALVSEHGAVEVGKRGFSLEPFVTTNGRTLSWVDGTHEQSLALGFAPIPSVTRHMDGLDLRVTTAAVKAGSSTTLVVEYSLVNSGKVARNGALHIAVRPFQVNPTWQRLNFEGGVSPIRSITAGDEGGYASLLVNGNQPLVSFSAGGHARTARFEHDDIVGQIVAGVTSPISQVTDADGLASGEMAFDFSLAPGAATSFTVAGALQGHRTAADLLTHKMPAQELFAQQAKAWEASTGHATIRVPKADQWIADSFRAQLAYILINRDGPAIQPGSRSYERSWARDGSMTSASLLTAGFDREVREWVDWFGANQFESGKVPCVVDKRGPDPVPEHDSHGEYIWAVANYYRHTHDEKFLAEHWPRVKKAVAYIQTIRAERMTEAYKADTWPQRACYGLVPESISHEGYSAKPMHSYWDDLFVLLGLKEAAFIAAEMKDSDAIATYGGFVTEFRKCFLDSINRSMSHAKIDYIPGCVELGDFDSTSTTIALFPCDEQATLPRAALIRTFDKYWENAVGRMQPGATWNVYTPYELRHVGAFVRLGQRDRAYTLLNWFHEHQRPQGWHQWAEVVWQDPAEPKFIGDMPHTWVGSDFLNSVISMFVIEEPDRLELFAGVPEAWINAGDITGFSNFATRFGHLSASMQRVENQVRVHIEGEVAIPTDGISIRCPAVGVVETTDTVVRSLPADVVFHLR